MRRPLALLLLAGLAFAGGKDKTPPPAPPSPDDPKVWIHAPAEDLLPLKGAGFLITLEEYSKLLGLARDNEAKAREKPPIGGRLVRGACTAKIDGDVLRVTAKYTAVVQGEGPVEIPFRVEGIAIERVASLVGEALVFDKPGTYEVEALLSARLAREGDLLRATFRLPPAAGHTVALELPPEVEGEVGPIVRAFRSGASGGQVVGYPDEKGLFQLWMRPLSPARRMDALLSASFDTVAEIGEARTGLLTSLSVTVLRAPVDGIEIVLAPGQTVQALDGKNVKSWRLVRGAPDDVIEVKFTEPVQETVALSLETDLPRNQVETATVPVVRVRNAARYRGTVGVVARPEVKIEGIAATGVRRLEGAPQRALALYEVWSETAGITATVKRVEARAEAATRTLLAFREGGKSLQTLIGIEITGDPLFRLEPALPRGWLVRWVNLDGNTVPYTYEADGRLVLEFPEGLKPGRHWLQVTMDTDEVDWVPNTGSVAFELSGVRSGLPFETGLLVVASDPAFRVNVEGRPQGLTETGMDEAARRFGGATDRMLFAWRYEAPGYAAKFTLERHEPQITATVVTHLVPGERTLSAASTILFDIKRTGVRELKVSLPKGTGPLVDIQGPMIKEKRAPGKDADPETWTIVFQRRIRGQYRLDLSFDETFDADAWSAVAPEIAVPDAQERGFVVVHSSGTTEISVKREGLREADVGELPAQPDRPPLEVLAYAQHPYKVEISSRRHDPEPVVQAIALSAEIYGVVSPDGRVRCRAQYLVRNNDQPFLKMTLPEGSELLGALAGGEPLKPLREGGALKLPLPRSKDRETPFEVAVIYETRVKELGAKGQLVIERPALDIEVLETSYRLHLPDGYRLTGFDGDLVPMGIRERESVLQAFWRAVPSFAADEAAPGAERNVSEADVERLREGFVDEGILASGGVGGGGGGADNNEVVMLFTKLAEGVELQKELERNGQVALLEEVQDSNRVLYMDVVEKARELNIPLPKLPPPALRATKELPYPTTPTAEPPGDAGAPAAEPQKPESAKDLKKTGGKRAKDKAPAKEVEKKAGSDHNEVDTDAELEDRLEKNERGDQPNDAPAESREESEESADEVTATAAGTGGGAGGGRSHRRFVAHGGEGPGQTPERPGGAEGKRARPERALLSLDIQFLKTDNLWHLRSLAPTGRVSLAYVRGDAYDRQGYLGLVLGAAASLALVFGRRRRLLLLLPGALLLLLSLHFAGLSFLPVEFAKGAAAALFAVVAIVFLARVLGTIGRKLYARLPWRKAAAAALLLAAATAARAGDEVLVPYHGDPGKADRVFLPADEYHRLRKLAYPETAGSATSFCGAQYEAVLEKGQLTLRARYEIAKETDDAERLPLALKDVAMTAALLDGKPASLAVEDMGYVLVLEGKGRRVLELELRPRVETNGDVVSFAAPVRPVALARLTLVHDLPGYDPKVAALGGAADALHYLGPVGVVACSFAPRVEAFRAKEAELRAETATVVSVRDGFTGVASRIRYGISGGSVSRLRVRVGKDLTVLSVGCADLAGWEVDGDGNLVVALAKPQDRALVLEVRAERKEARERAETAPDVAPLDVLRDAGILALETLPDLKVRVTEERGLLQARPEEAPGDLRAAADLGQVQKAYRYAVRPFSLGWRVDLEETRVRAEADVDLYVDRDRALAEATLRVTLERGPGPFTHALPVPAGYEVVAVSGDVRDWWVREGTLLLDRLTRLQGTQQYRIVLRRLGATTEPFTAPALALTGATGESGLVRLAVADGLEAEVRGTPTNLSPEDTAKAGNVRWGKLVRAFRYYATPYRLELFAREEPREMDAIVVSRVVPLADRIRVEALVDFHVRRGLVDGYSFVVPVAEEREALIVAHDRREIRSEGAPGGRRFFVTLRTPTRGSAALTVSYDVPYGTDVRGVEPLGAGTVTRYVAVEKAPDGEVRVARASNLDAADFADLPLRAPETTAQSVARVYVGAGAAFTLSLDVKRHAFEDVAKAVIYRALATAVVDRSGWTRVQVSYNVYNRSEQFLRLVLPEGARLLSVVVAGEGVRPLTERGDLLVPLRKLALGASSFDVDVVYAYSDSGVGREESRVRLPAVKGLDVRRTALYLHVPKGFSYDFDTGMEKVTAADLIAQEANDKYQLIKETYDVAQRGNRWQANRALSNVQQLDQDVRRLFEQVRENTRDAGKLQQVESQERALETLNKANRAQTESQPQQAQQMEEGEARGIESWGVNDAFLGRARAEQRKQVDEFRANQQRATQGPAQGDQTLEGTIYAGEQYKGPNGGVPPGLRDPSDPEPPPAPPDLARAALRDTGVETAGLEGMTTGGGGLFNDGEDGDYRARTEDMSLAGQPVERGYNAWKSLDGGDLSAAKGRISLRIELPQDGDVYFFSQLGSAEGVKFDASEKSRTFLHTALALLCLVLGTLLLRRKTLR